MRTRARAVGSLACVLCSLPALTTRPLPPLITPAHPADGKVQFFAGVQMEIRQAAEEAEEAALDGGGLTAAQRLASGVDAPQAEPLALLRQKGVVGSLRVATRALAQHGLRRSVEDQRTPCRAE